MSAKRIVSVVLVVSAIVILAVGSSPKLASDARALSPSEAQPAQFTATLYAEADATLKSWQPDSNFGDDDTLELSFGSDPEPRAAFILLRFDLSHLPDNAVIDSAVLQVYLVTGSGIDPVMITAYAVTSPWQEEWVNWTSMPSVAAMGTVGYVDTNTGYQAWNATGFAVNWQGGTNYGVELRGPLEGASWTRTFQSREWAGDRPRLVVTYHVESPLLSGYVFDGEMDDESQPLAGVTVSLYGGTGPYPAEGEFLTSTTTDAQGWYSLGAPTGYEFYHLRETDLPGYVSVGAASVGGTVRTSNWIEYTYPVEAKTLTGNNFWDQPETPEDTVPPNNWQDFVPSGWVTDQTVTAQVQVEDNGSGLNVSTAAYSFSTDGGSSWSSWQTASCSGSDGTTEPQTLTATSVPFGQDTTSSGLNLIRFRVSDMVHNTGESGTYSLQIDAGPPQNPTTLFSGTHEPGVWSNLKTVTCQWLGALDAVSGLAGYSYTWDHSPSTVPDSVVDTDLVATSSFPMADDDDWWFHVRAVDNAGNGAEGAVHHGPFYIDTAPPTAWLTAPAPGDLNAATFDVSWSGSDASSGVASYHVQTSDNGLVWEDWLMAYPYETASFSGERGETYHFRVRARDQAGNVGDWSSPRQVRLGVTVTVRVEDENGSPLSGAEIYRFGELEGTTDSVGTRTLYDLLLGDELSARYHVEQQASEKSLHNWLYGSSGSWAYRIYLTSLDFDDTGDPVLFSVNNTEVTQVLRVRRDNPLVGLYMLASVEWDASSTFLRQLQAGFESASHYLFDLTDGQIYLEVLDIRDNAEAWVDADCRVHASNQQRPVAGFGGIWHGADGHISVGRYWDGGSSNQGAWDEPNAFRTLVHELGHYGLDLRDEYLDATGAGGGRCTTDRGTTPEREGACFMDYQYTTTEVCSHLPLHPHSTNTMQHAVHGEPCWDTIHDRYSDEQVPARWFVERPQDRGSIMPGPTAIPVGGWMKSRIVDGDTGVCPPFDLQFLHDDGSMALGLDVWVENGREIFQGQTITNTTATAGTITILGAHTGDTVRVYESWGPFTAYSGSKLVTCSTRTTTDAPEPIILTADSFGLEVNIHPLDDGATLEILAQASTTLVAAPEVHVWQEGAIEPILVALTFDGSEYAGTAVLEPSLGLRGHVRAQATATNDDTVTTLGFFSAERASAIEITRVKSSDGRAELFLKPGSLPGEPVVGVMATTAIELVQGNLAIVGRPYRVTASYGAANLEVPATMNIYYQTELPAGVDPSTLGLYQWDAQNERWISAGGKVDTEYRFVSAQVTQISTYAIMAEEASRIYLPLILRR